MDPITAAFNIRFEKLHERWLKLIQLETPNGEVIGESGRIGVDTWRQHLVRSAGVVEQVFGGINAQLWDDPIEWTLPEALQSEQELLAYIEEVVQTRSNGFARITSDRDLTREIWTPAGMRTIADVLDAALLKATESQKSAELERHRMLTPGK